MPDISIKTCSHTTNANALEAVRQWMLSNVIERHYVRERVIPVLDGTSVKVTEIDIDGESICDCSFTVEKVSS